MIRYCMRCLKKDGKLYGLGLCYNNIDRQLTAMKMNNKCFYIVNPNDEKDRQVFNIAHAYIMIQYTMLQRNDPFSIFLNYKSTDVKMLYGKLLSIGDFEVIDSEAIINWLTLNICDAGLFVECSKKYRRSLPANYSLNNIEK
ncbi:MAG TPA: hypothetical protein DCE23_00655 [Firmicutes bacterium]|nr:hypothetical protein [Bacillota bacterium]